MGGDGGSLNNSRHEHTRLRLSVLHRRDAATEAAYNSQRASTTHCALTQVPLRPPHVVGDRLGQLYDKEGLLRHLLRRAARERGGEGEREGEEERLGGCGEKKGNINWDGGEVDVVSHIRSMKRDTVDVKLMWERKGERDGADGREDVDRDGFVGGSGATTFVCPLTRRAVTPDGRFSFGWRCGCVVADGIPVPLSSREGGEGAGDGEVCMVCGAVGQRVRLGMTRAERKALLSGLLEEQQRRKARAQAPKRKRKRDARDSHHRPVATDSGMPQNPSCPNLKNLRRDIHSHPPSASGVPI